jgi:hypothetical protein
LAPNEVARRGDWYKGDEKERNPVPLAKTFELGFGQANGTIEMPAVHQRFARSPAEDEHKESGPGPIRKGV